MVSRTSVDDRSSVLKRIEAVDCRTPNVNSPRPTPVFFREQTFSTKKERQTPRECPPPTPRPRTNVLKSCPANRLLAHSFSSRAQCVSFRESESRLSSKFYDVNNSKSYLSQCFDIICKVGSGSFGEVYKVQSKEDGRFYAVKRSKERFRGKSDRLRRLEEVKKHEQLPEHQNCVAFYKAWEEKGYLYIQTELCETSLSQYTEENHDIPESTVWNYLVDLLLAVKHLHDHNFVHLDIKPDNIFISENGICKLGDFGLVFDLSKGDTGDALEGDPKYLAPELMQGHFTKAADVFSLGITILELACDLDLPRGDTAWHQLRQGQIPYEFTKRLSPELTEVIRKMMEPDYKTRLSVSTVLQMPAVLKVYKKRKLFLKVKSVLSCMMVTYHWITFLSYWIKSFLLRKVPYFQKKSVTVSTPSREDQKPPAEWDYSFSDEEVFDGDASFPDTSTDDVCTALFKDPERVKCEVKDRLAMTTPPALKYLEHKLDDSSCSPCFSKFSPHKSSSPKSTRRSPRLAAKRNESNDSFSVGPKCLMDLFEEESPSHSSS